MSRRTAFKNEQVILDNLFFLNGEADKHRADKCDVNMIVPFTCSKSYQTAEEQEKKKKERKGNGVIRLTTAQSACGPGFRSFCDWSERIRRSGNTVVLQSDNH